MILTVTMNPSVDISYPLKKFIIDDVNRVTDVRKTAGGKGLNVTRSIHFSSTPVIATGVLGGTTGEYIKKQLDADNIGYNFYQTPHESRNCIAILHEGCQTEILETGPTLSPAEVSGFKRHYQKLLKQCQVVTTSGSLPQGFAFDFYADMIELAKNSAIPVLLDCSGQALKATLQSNHKPYLIKPNSSELAQLIQFDIEPTKLDSLKTAANHPLLQGVEIIVISLGANGAFVKYRNQYFKVSIPKIEVVNPVGSGDVTLGGLAVSILKQEDIITMMKRAMTMGMLNTMEAQTGFVNMNHYEHYFQQVTVEEIN